MAGNGTGHDQRLGDPLPIQGPILSIDWGTKRIGIALSDPHQTVAHPVAVLTRRAGQRFPLKKLRALLEEHRPSGVLVSLPLESDGTEGETAKAARAVARAIRDKTDLPVRLFDERMTTARVIKAMEDHAIRTQHRSLDELAATVLLQSYLDAMKS